MKHITLIATFWLWSISVAFATDTFEDRLLNLGVDEDFTKLERGMIKDQVKNFIPPLLVPALTGHAYVLPPGLFNFSTSFKFVMLMKMIGIKMVLVVILFIERIRFNAVF